MRRSFTTALLLGVLTPAVLAAPVATAAGGRPHPVAPSVAHLGLEPVPAAVPAGTPESTAAGAGAALAARPQEAGAVGPLRALAATAERATGAFTTLGVTWAHDSAVTGVAVEARWRAASGGWSSWHALDADGDHAPDDAGPDAGPALRDGTAPLWVGPARGVQVRVGQAVGQAGGAAVPRDLRVELVDPGTSAADAPSQPSSTAHAEAAQPAVITRAQWGADERLRGAAPAYSSTIKVGFVHHTDTANDYTPEQAAAMVRSVYAFHTQSRGWSDIGYNFLVDKYGRVFEGRYGGIDRPVIGAHTGGFNTNSFAASLLGNYEAEAPPQVALDAVAQLFGWKLGMYHRDPHGTQTLVSAGGGTARWPAGTPHTFDVVSGHRDAGFTACPGTAAYAKLPGLRDAVQRDMGVAVVEPALSTTSTPYRSDGPVLTFLALLAQTWQVQLRDVCDDRVLRTVTGAADGPTSVPLALVDDSGEPLRPGSYRLDLTSAGPTDRAVPWSTTLSVTGTVPPADQKGAPRPAAPTGYVPVTPSRLLDTRTGQGVPGGSRQALADQGRVDLQVAGVGGVPAVGVQAVALNVTGTCATSAAYLSAYPADAAWGGTSSLNVAPGSTRASLVVPKVSADGKVSVRLGGRSSDAVVDVVGYYPAYGGSLLHLTGASRLLDTREGAPVADQEVRHVAAGSTVPPTATAVVLNVTVDRAAGGGYVSVYPTGATRPGTSSVNFARGAAVPNRVVTGLTAGSFDLFLEGAPADVVVDLVGWYAPAAVPSGGVFTPLDPTRVLDTRTGTGVHSGPVGPGSVLEVPVAGRGGVPADARGVVMTLTGTQSTSTGYVTAYRHGAPRPPTSDLNLGGPGANVANLVVVALGKGSVDLYNDQGSTHLVGDVLGYYR